MAEQGHTPGGRRGYAGTWPPRAAAPVGGFVPSIRWPPLIETLRQWARAEAGAGRLLPWVPVAFGTGIAFYFAADHEPVLPVAVFVAVLLCAVAFVLRQQKFFAAAGKNLPDRNAQPLEFGREDIEHMIAIAPSFGVEILTKEKT